LTVGYFIIESLCLVKVRVNIVNTEIIMPQEGLAKKFDKKYLGSTSLCWPKLGLEFNVILSQLVLDFGVKKLFSRMDEQFFHCRILGTRTNCRYMYLNVRWSTEDQLCRSNCP
jgi:hypothetical protein